MRQWVYNFNQIATLKYPPLSTQSAHMPLLKPHCKACYNETMQGKQKAQRNLSRDLKRSKTDVRSDYDEEMDLITSPHGGFSYQDFVLSSKVGVYVGHT